ncbi:MAG: hypothetical protein FJ149_11055 [Euryarchaeota archaeon]|nr:hypothetical protein [Euryarchaeota archaeon]
MVITNNGCDRMPELEDIEQYLKFEPSGAKNCPTCNGRGIVCKVIKGNKTWLRKNMIISTTDKEKGITAEEIPSPGCRKGR